MLTSRVISLRWRDPGCGYFLPKNPSLEKQVRAFHFCEVGLNSGCFFYRKNALFSRDQLEGFPFFEGTKNSSAFPKEKVLFLE